MGVWRALLVCGMFIPAFLCSLLLSPGTALWAWVTALWVAVFLFCYLLYLPTRLRRLSLAVEEDRFILTAGVFSRVTRTVPFESVQFLSLRSSPLHRYKKLCTLVIIAPGGRMSMPGLEEEEAKRLVSAFFYNEDAQK